MQGFVLFRNRNLGLKAKGVRAWGHWVPELRKVSGLGCYPLRRTHSTCFEFLGMSDIYLQLKVVEGKLMFFEGG